MAVISSISSGIRWTTILLVSVCLFGLAMVTTIVLSLISVYLPNRGAGLARSTLCKISFSPMVPIAVDQGPVAIIAADFNNDNRLDIGVTSFDENTVSVLLGDGNGDFNQQIKLSTENNFQMDGIVAGDLNNDNNLDIVVTSSSGSTFGVFLGYGNGTFSEQTTYSTGINSEPLEAALGDLNGDNIIDLVISDNGTNTLLIFLGNGNGSFTQTHTLSTGNNSGPFGVIINYFNKDSYLDIAVANSLANNVGIFIGNGTGNFGGQTTYSSESGPDSLVAGDFNRDSVLDIASADFYGNSTSVFLGNGDGTFRHQKTFSTGDGSAPDTISIGDFNRDNKLDLITPNTDTNNVGILLGYGNGNFRSPTSYSTGNSSAPLDVAVGDFNKDNRLDFISTNYFNNTVGIFLNTCS